MPDRNGRRKTREQAHERRSPRLGYYLILTDTEETEKNYMLGLRDSIPVNLKEKLVIKVRRTDTKNLVQEALKEASTDAQYREIWIIFDRDQVKNFDSIVAEAERNGIHVVWSNPCIEVWFSAYFGAMLHSPDSKACCRDFSREFEQKTGHKYEKSDSDIYRKLCQYGNERTAITIAQSKYNEYSEKQKPSKRCPCTTVHTLIEEIVEKAGKQ